MGLNRKRVVTNLHVRCEVKRPDRDLIVIETWLLEEHRNMYTHKCLEIDRWYLLIKIAGFLRYVIEPKLNSAK